jgi:predicted ABC-type ATPase
LFVLAGVNGAGKSSIGGHVLQAAGMSWFNPDTFARELVAELGYGQTEANGLAWTEGVRRLDAALAAGHSHAFETTLGGQAIPAKIKAAATTHDVLLWYCGLASPEQHIARVKARVAVGGHDIPEAKIRERWRTSMHNLVDLLPHISQLQVYDNSFDVALGRPLPDPALVAHVRAGRVLWPKAKALAATPQWAKPLVEALLQRQDLARR